jgi:excisionase family DNA binding protein
MSIDDTIEAAVARAIDRHLGAIRADLAELKRGQAPQYLTVDQAAAALECHPNTVRRMVADGQLRYKRVGRGIRIDGGSLHGAGGDQRLPRRGG